MTSSHDLYTLYSAPTRTLSSDILSQIRSNHIPSPSEKDHISQCISDSAKARLSRYDDEIARAQAIVMQLQRERAELEQYIDGYRCLQAPVRALPTEIITDVFLFLRPHYLSDRINSPTGLMPLKLGMVCSRWRNIALSTESLWSDIYVDIWYQFSSRMLETYLERSGQSSLSIHLNGGDFPDQCQSPLIAIIAQHSARWLRATLDLEIGYFLPGRPLAALAGTFPILEDLAIRPRHEITCFFKDCSSLQTLEFHLSERCSGLDSIPWCQIVVLHIRNLFLQDILPLLSQSLTHLTVSAAAEQWHVSLTLYPRATLNIHSLSILIPYGSECKRIAELFAVLTLPNLKSLSIEIRDSDDNWSHWHIAMMSLLRRSACTLQTLALHPAIMTHPQLEEILLLTPTVMSLSLHEPALDGAHPPFIVNTLLQSLTITSDAGPGSFTDASTCLLPSLVHLDLAVTFYSAFDNQLFMSMLESRVVVVPRVRSSAPVRGSGSSSACLRQVTLTVRSPEKMPRHFHERVQNLRDCGIKIALRSAEV